ncbi:MAG: hypothetical protein LQ340_003224 [Diploschistes diacapsis]|nr:MAG: hypothetical protein LQ340_003224 [Diploschistes diacapsis]
MSKSSEARAASDTSAGANTSIPATPHAAGATGTFSAANLLARNSGLSSYMVAYAARTFKTQTRPRAATYLCQVYRNWGEDLTIPGPLTDLFLDPSKPGDYVAVDALQTLASWSNRFCGQKDRFIRKFKAMLAAKPRLKTIVGAPKQRRLKHSDLSVLHKALLRDPNQLETATGASVHTSATSDVQDQNQSPASTIAASANAGSATKGTGSPAPDARRKRNYRGANKGHLDTTEDNVNATSISNAFDTSLVTGSSTSSANPYYVGNSDARDMNATSSSSSFNTGSNRRANRKRLNTANRNVNATSVSSASKTDPLAGLSIFSESPYYVGNYDASHMNATGVPRGFNTGPLPGLSTFSESPYNVGNYGTSHTNATGVSSAFNTGPAAGSSFFSESPYYANHSGARGMNTDYADNALRPDYPPIEDAEDAEDD